MAPVSVEIPHETPSPPLNGLVGGKARGTVGGHPRARVKDHRRRPALVSLVTYSRGRGSRTIVLFGYRRMTESFGVFLSARGRGAILGRQAEFRFADNYATVVAGWERIYDSALVAYVRESKEL